jgi:hypothetical protein
MEEENMKKFLVCVMVVLFALTATTVMAQSKGPASADTFRDLFTKGKADGWLKANYWTREFENSDPDWATLNFGLKLGFKSAVYNGFSFRTSFYANEDFGLNDAGDDQTVYSLLARADGREFDPYQTFGEYYVKYQLGDTAFTLGMQEMVTAGFSNWWARMIPMAHENFNVVNTTIKGLKLTGGYAWAYRDTNNDVRRNVGLYFSGLNDDAGWLWGEADYTGIKGARLVFAYHYYEDSMQAFNFHGTYKGQISKEVGYNLFGLYTPISAVGDGLGVGGEDYDTYHAGLRAGMNWGGHALTGYYAWVGDEASFMPRGAFKGIQFHIQGVEEADEEGWGIEYNYKFSGAAKGLSAYAVYAQFDRQGNDQDEIDLGFRYRPSTGMLANNDFYVRLALVDEDNDGPGEMTDFRFYYTYYF